MSRISLIFSSILIICSVTGHSFALIWPCETNDDCTAVGSVCSPKSGLCECTDFGSVFSNDYTKCLKTSLIGDQCEETVQCNLMPSGANCKTGVCDCVDGHTYVRGRCRPLNGLDQPCDTDLDCYFGYDRSSVSCQNQICACANGYYRRNGNICRRKSMEIDDACVVDTDCDELGPTVKCLSLKCQRSDNKEIDTYGNNNNNNATKTKLKTETSITSETTSQFSKSSKSFEEDSVIDSPSSPKQRQPKSEQQQHTQSADETKTKTAEVQVQTASKNVAASDAAIFVNGVDDLLELDTESSKQTSLLEHKKRLREIAVQTSLENFELKPLSSSVASQVRNVGTATASTSTSSRRASYYRHRLRLSAYRPQDDEDKTFSTLSNTDDDVDENKFGSSCTENGKPCNGVAHSICSNSMCLCRQGYYSKGGKCFAELGEIAESADECEHTFEALSKKCTCQNNYFYERNLRACRKPIQYHLSCTSNSQCSPFGASFCRPDIPRRCTCEEYAEYDALRQLCIYKQGLGAQCESNDGCPVEHSVCSNRYCVCKNNFVQMEDVCVAGVGADCKLDDDCYVDNAICADTTALTKSSDDDEEIKERTCQCRKGFVHFKDECLKEATEIDDECIDSEQCKPLLGTCKDKKCTCTPEQHFKNGRCEDKKGIGEACSKAGECITDKEPDNVECRNSICQCKFGYQADVEQRSCIRVMPNKKNSSGRPSALKIITFLLIGSAFLITSAAIKQAYY